MSEWLFYAILAPGLWSVINIFDSVLRHHYIKSDYALTFLASLLKLIVAFVIFGFIGFSWPSNSAGFYMLLSGILWVIPILFYLKALFVEETSRVVLFLQVTPIFTLLIAYLLLGETLTTHQWIAFMLILVGSFLAAMRRLESKWHFSSALFLMIIASLLWSLSDVLFKYAEPAFPSFGHAMGMLFLGAGITFPLLAFFTKNPLKDLRHIRHMSLTGWIMTIASEFFEIGAIFAFAYALTMGKVSLTQVLTGLQPLFVFVIAILLAPYFKYIKKEALDRQSLFFKASALILIMAGLWVLQ